MAAACCRLPVWGSRRPCDRAKMDACTMRVGKLQSYLLPSLSLASMLSNAPTAKRTQRLLTTRHTAPHSFMRYVSAIHINKCQILSPFILSAA